MNPTPARICTLAVLLLTSAACGDSSGRGMVDTGTIGDSGSIGDAALMDSGSEGDAQGDGGADTSVADTGLADDTGSEADTGAPPTGDPTGTGPFEVTTLTGTASGSGRSVPVVAHLPTRADGAPSPVALFHPGFLTPSTAYVSLASHLASHGIVVVRVDPPGNQSFLSSNHVEQAEDVAAAIDWALSELAAEIDGTNFATFGHSLGGKVAVMVAADDGRVDAVLGLDPINGGGPIGYSAARPDIVPDDVTPLTIPVGFAGETNDTGGFMPCAPADQNYSTFYAAATGASWAAEWTFTAAKHMDFVTDPASCGLSCTTCTQSASAASVAEATKTIAAAFMLRHLVGRTDVEPWLTGASVPSGVTTRSR